MTARPPSRSFGGTAARGTVLLPRAAEVADTMLDWERFLTGHPRAVAPAGNFVVSSWRRSLALGVDPAGRTAPLLAHGNAMHQLRLRHRDLLRAAADLFAELTELLAGSRSIMLLTDPDGVVLEAVGDPYILEQGQDIHLMQGGAWSEAVVGTNGIGTALATGRPAQIHAAEHFCEGIKRWTCAAAPVYQPDTGEILGIVDISGPPATYQRNNLALVVTTARRIEAALGETAAQERTRLLEVCLQRLSSADAAGLVAIDRSGRLVHSAGRVASPVGIGQLVPGLQAHVDVEAWAQCLPVPWRPEWFNPVSLHGRVIGAILVVPDEPHRRQRSLAGRLAGRPGGSEADPRRGGFDAVIGHSAPMLAAIARARLLARHRVPVLIEGETGVGKELFARAMHGGNDPGGAGASGDASGAERPFVVFNCGAVSRELVAGELFGHVRGAFTGASSEGRPGRFELAHQGTLCLDEIGELPLDLQPVLLRALEEGVVYRLGDTQPRRVEVRLIAITNRNLREEVAAGRFRRDLFYRIGVTTLTVPPLRTRGTMEANGAAGGDIDLLVAHFNASLATRHGIPARVFSPEAMAALRAQPWPGNVRELRNLMETLLLTGTDPVVGCDELAALLPEPAAVPDGGGLASVADHPALAPFASLHDTEQTLIARALHLTHGNMLEAARLLGISRSTLYRKLERLGVGAAAVAVGRVQTLDDQEPDDFRSPHIRS